MTNGSFCILNQDTYFNQGYNNIKLINWMLFACCFTLERCVYCVLLYRIDRTECNECDCEKCMIIKYQKASVTHVLCFLCM
jgi:hypothetical protein